MSKLRIRLFQRQSNGDITDALYTTTLSEFAGCLPNVGDLILKAGVQGDLDRSAPENRTFWTVLQRVFNPCDDQDTVAIIVEERRPTVHEHELLPSVAR